MVETLERLQSHHGSDSKGIIWAHNTHVGDARATDMEQRGQAQHRPTRSTTEGRSETALIGMGTYRGDRHRRGVVERADGGDDSSASTGRELRTCSSIGPAGTIVLVTDDLDDDAALGQPVGIALSASCTIPTANPETTCRPSFPIATTRSSTSTKRVRSIRSPSTPTERTSRTSIRGDCDPIGPVAARDSAADREESRL